LPQHLWCGDLLQVLAFGVRDGKSSHPAIGYGCDTFAADLHAIIEHLDLTDVGFRDARRSVGAQISLFSASLPDRTRTALRSRVFQAREYG
jgi:hypothetical protein